VTAGELIKHLRTMLTSGKSEEAMSQALAMARTADPGARADMLLLRLAGVINLGQRDAHKQALDDAADAVRAEPTPDRYARLYAFAAVMAHLDGALEKCVEHLVRAGQALALVTRRDEEIACTWHDLAMAYSYVGFHGHALGAMERSRTEANLAGALEGQFITPAIRIRLAVAHDHLGDSESCLRVLRGVVDDLPRHQQLQQTEGQPMKPASMAAYGYAIARLATLGELVEVDPRPLLGPAAAGSQRVREFRHLADVCLRIAGGRTEDALRRLAETEVSPSTAGAAEPYRLRALAHLTAGRPGDAYVEDRRAFRVASSDNERIRTRFVQGTAALIQHLELQRQLARFQGEASTDPLTGLPNRRYLEQHVQSLVEQGAGAMVAVCDLDGFKQVNDVHGHLVGDLVLQRVAVILSRVTRREDLVARYGGDEFVVVMPRVRPAEAADTVERIQHAVSCEDWSSVAPGTPIGITVGCAFAEGQAALQTAFVTADKAMLRAKPADNRRSGRRIELTFAGPPSLAS